MRYVSLSLSEYQSSLQYSIGACLTSSFMLFGRSECRDADGRTDTVTRIIIFGDDITLPLNKLAKYRRHVGRVYFDKYS